MVSLAANAFTEIKDLNQLETELNKKGKFIILFHTERCEYCKQEKEVLNKLESEMKDVNFVRINPEKVRIPKKLPGVPLIAVGSDGNLVRAVVGFKTEQELKALIGLIK